MPRLIVNPGSPAAWEIQLKPGTNLLGRGFANDFRIEDPSVSGSHCQITVNGNSAVIKDLGSTNGVYVNRSPVQEAALQEGYSVHVGGVEMAFTADAPAPVTATRVHLPPPVPRAVAVAVEAAPPPPVEMPTASADVPTGPQVCKSHPKTPARFYCPQCHKAFCELCVTSRFVSGVPQKFCRHCGVPCSPLQVQMQRAAGSKGFFARLPGVFIYPFKGSGLLVLIVATLVFAGLDAMSGFFSLILTAMAIGYLFSYMQNIIHSTASEENEMPDLPGMDGLFGAFFTLVGTVAFCYCVPIGLFVARVAFDVEAIPMEAVIATMVLSCLYFPMGFLAVAMKDTVAAVNPLVVVPAILKAPLEYFVTAILLTGVFGVRLLGNVVSFGAGQVSFVTKDMSTLFIALGVKAIWSFASVYLLTVGMRILGVLYVTKKHKFGWFSH
jgi:hypothetical protein